MEDDTERTRASQKDGAVPDIRSSKAMAAHTRNLREAIFGADQNADRSPEPQAKPQTAAATYTSPMHRYSLRGLGNQLAADAVAKVPLLGDVCIAGDITIWGAPANSGKTLFAIGLLADAIINRAVEPERTFYLNMDDSMNGVVEKVSILQDYGVHVLAEGYRDFSSSKVQGLLDAMIADGSARDAFVIVDTLKKVENPMDKPRIIAFMKLCRRFVLAGGSILLLAHTNKQRGGDGQLILAGVADLQDDCDTAYLMDRRVKGDTQQIVFDNVKRRGGGASRSVYTCSADPDLAYVDRLFSIRFAGSNPDFDETAPDEKTEEASIVEMIELAIHHGTRKKMTIIDLVRKASKASRRDVAAVLEKHTGPDPAVHRWDYAVEDRGANVYSLHQPIEDRAAA